MLFSNSIYETSEQKYIKMLLFILQNTQAYLFNSSYYK